MESGTWPEAVLRHDAPLSARVAQVLVINLKRASADGQLGLRALSERAGISHTTLGRMLRGEALPEVGTIAQVENFLGFQVWPDIFQERNGFDFICSDPARESMMD